MLAYQILLGNGPLFSYTFVTSVSPKSKLTAGSRDLKSFNDIANNKDPATKEIKYLDLLAPLRLQFSGSNWLFLSLISLDRHRGQGF